MSILDSTYLILGIAVMQVFILAMKDAKTAHKDPAVTGMLDFFGLNLTVIICMFMIIPIWPLWVFYMIKGIMERK